MQGTLGPDVARVAVSLHRSHPHAPVLDVLDTVMRQRTGRLADLGDIGPASAFGQLLVEAFDTVMTPAEWAVVASPTADPTLVAALLKLWPDVVLAPFAARYGLSVVRQ